MAAMSDQPSTDAALPDGAHDALVIDAHDGIDDLGRPTQRLDLTVVSGVSKGFVVTIVTGVPLGDEIALIGMPCTITVRDGQPTVVIDD
jgi:hypothetical protein